MKNTTHTIYNKNFPNNKHIKNIALTYVDIVESLELLMIQPNLTIEMMDYEILSLSIPKLDHATEYYYWVLALAEKDAKFIEYDALWVEHVVGICSQGVTNGND